MNVLVNPLQGNLSISVPSILEDITLIEIQNGKGEIIFTKQLMAEGEIHLNEINLNKGDYQIKVKKGDHIFKKGILV